ncbi:hypothetical protein GLOIN_2v1777628 [Rhizophagus clarus]|uniref:DUF7869 domain-containing protein n=1 Tax=Rhizophagus clarus TaxID=94130 RepID=A0A8H3LS23_9GLOM|nr:hypothetical protein GLOIN_2v1777628 [Rhizophagus clarus]
MTSTTSTSNKNHHLFDSIFAETHSKLSNIQDQIQELQFIYQSNESNSTVIPYEGESLLVELVIEPISIELEAALNEPINKPTLNDNQINKFKQIYSKNKIKDSTNQDEDIIYCKEKCLQNKVAHENALKNYQNFQTFNNSQKDMFILGVLSATARNEMITISKKRQRLDNNYVFEGMQIYSTAFLTIYGIGEKYWRNIRNHYSQQEISPRVYKLTGRLSNSSLSFEKILEILTFIVNYANIHGLPFPGQHFQRDTLLVTFLPASESYSSLYRLYTSTIKDLDQKIIHLTTFWHIWNKYIPEIKFLSPRSDLCFKCKEYQNCIQASKIFLKQQPNFSEYLRPNNPNSFNFENHILWDYAKQVKILFSSQQEGSIYFKFLYNIQVFGICEDAFPIQRNYLIKEEESIGKGANAVISLVHNYFTLYEMGETELVIHADNCARQNKNNAMIMYLAWRVACGLHTKITYSFIVAGHTKFSPNRFFGLFKLKLQKSDVDNLDDLVNVVENSTLGGYNQAQTIFNKNGDHVVHFYNWIEYLLKFFKTIPNILKYHHFTFHMNNVGKVEIKEKVDGNTQIINIKKNNDIIGFSREIFPEKLSAKRQWYLYEQVLQHIGDPQKQDEYCSLPNVEKPKSN